MRINTFLLGVTIFWPVLAGASGAEPGYVGRAECVACHADQDKLWIGLLQAVDVVHEDGVQVAHADDDGAEVSEVLAGDRDDFGGGVLEAPNVVNRAG